MEPKSCVFPQRFSTSITNFSYVEKFDTWLNLGSWAKILDHMDLCSKWEEVPRQLMSPMLGSLDLAMIQARNLPIESFRAYIVSPILPSLILLNAMNRPSSVCHISSRDMRIYHKVSDQCAANVFYLQLGHLRSCLGPHALDTITSYEKDWAPLIKGSTPVLLGLMNIYEDLLLVINIHKQLVSVRSQRDKNLQAETILKLPDQKELRLPSLNASVVVYPSFIVMEYEGQTWLCPLPYFLEIYNKVSETISLLKYAQIQSKTVYDKSYIKHVESFLTHIAQKVVRQSYYGGTHQNMLTRLETLELDNRGFVYLKTMEGLGVAELIKRSDEKLGWENTSLVETLWSSLYKERLTSTPSWTLSDTCRLFAKFDSAQLAGILGVVKLAGHPSIEIERGLEKLYQRTHSEITIDPVRCQRARAIMTRDIVKNFYKTHNSYPKFQMDTLQEALPLYQLVTQRIPITDPLGVSLWRSITIEDWMQVRFDKNAEFDEVDNQVMLLKDKALGYRRSRVLESIICNTSDDNTTHQKKDHRRALLAFLLDSKFDKGFRKYLSLYMSQDNWTRAVLDYLVIKLTAKELEEKPEGRYFGASPAYERNRRVVQEANNMAFMDKYVPEQLLTPNELTIIKKMYSFRSLHTAHPDCLILNISFDFSKWNNNMRHESVDIPAGTVLDDWFGVNLYSKTMKAFEHMLVYYNDGVTSRHWVGQKGGIEGLNQATWTFTFLGGLKDALESLGYIYHITVKGDDVRCALVIPKRSLNALLPHATLQERVETIKTNLMNELQRLCSAMGWELNPQESFVSMSLIATSKQYQIHDTWLPTDSKKIMKLEALSNVAFPTMEDIISNIYSTAHSTCAQATVASPAYIVATWTASRFLYRCYHPYRQHNQIEADITASLLWPQIIGGIGALPLQTFFVRGENDMLSVSLSMVTYVYYNLPKSDPVRRRLGFILRQKIKRDSDPVMLLSDPYSIDIDCPPRPASVIKSKIRQQLLKFCKQPEILKLLRPGGDKQRSAFIRTLFSLSPYYAKIATALWECSPFYLIEEILAKFLNSSSIIGFLTQGQSFHVFSQGGQKILEMLSNLSQERLMYWFNVLDGHHIAKPDKYFGLVGVDEVEGEPCKTWFAKTLRNRAWAKDIRGLTYPSLVDQVKIYNTEDVALLHRTRGWDPRNTYSQICLKHLHAIPQIDTDSHHFSSVKDNHPWLGSQTASSVTLPFQSDNIASPSLRKLRRLLTLLSSANIFGPTFETVITKLLTAYTDIPLEQLKVLCPDDGGGHLAHRTPINSYSLTTMPNYRPNLSQLVCINNENMDILKVDNVNRTMNFAARHFFLIPMVLWPLQQSSKLDPSYPQMFYSAFHHDNLVEQFVLCPHCNDVVDDEPVEFEICPEFEMDHFLRFSIISCSEAENATLEKSVVDVIKKGVMSHIHRMGLNADNPIVVQSAVMATFQRLLSSMAKFKSHMALEGVVNVPDGELMDVLSVGVGVASISKHGLSISVLRSCKPRFIVNSLLKEAYWHAVRVSYSYDLLYSTSPLGQLTSHHYEDFAYLFQQIAQAGLLSALSKAAETPTSAIENDGYPYFKLMFRHGSEKSGVIASASFFSSVWPMFNVWLANAQIPQHILCPLIEGKTIDDIITKIEAHQKTVKSLSFHIVHLSTVTRHGSTKTALRQLHQDLAEELRDDTISGYRKCLLIVEWLAETHAESLLRIYLLVTIYHWLYKVELTHETLIPPAQSHNSIMVVDVDPDLLNLYLEGLAQPMSLDTFEDGHKGMMYICRNIPEINTASLRDTLWSFIHEDASRLLQGNENYQDYLRDVVSNVLRVLQPFLSVAPFVSCMELDSAIIKDYRKNLSEQIIEQEYPALQMQPLTRANNVDAVIPYIVRRYCTLDHNPVAPSVNYSPSHWKRTGLSEITHQTLQQLEALQKISIPLSNRKFITIDLRNCFKIFGGINKSSIKYLAVLYELGAIPWIASQRKPIGVFLGDGGGSCSRLFTSLFEQGECVMVSLHITDSSTTRNLDHFNADCPAELQPSVMETEQKLRIHYQGLYPGDITIPGVQNILLDMVRQLCDHPCLIIGEADLPPNAAAMLDIVTAYLTIFDHCGGPDTLLLIRLNLHSHQFPIQILLCLRQMFNHFHVHEVSTSSATRNEMIVSMSGPRLLKLSEIFKQQTEHTYLDYTPPVYLQQLVLETKLWMISKLSLMTGEVYDHTFLSQDYLAGSMINSLPLAPVNSILEKPMWISLVPRLRGCPCQIYASFTSSVQSLNLSNEMLLRRSSLPPNLHKLRHDYDTNSTLRQAMIRDIIATLTLSVLLSLPQFEVTIDMIEFTLSNIPAHLERLFGRPNHVTCEWKTAGLFIRSLTDDTPPLNVGPIVQSSLDIYLRFSWSIIYQLQKLRQIPLSECTDSVWFWQVPNNPHQCCKDFVHDWANDGIPSWPTLSHKMAPTYVFSARDGITPVVLNDSARQLLAEVPELINPR